MSEQYGASPEDWATFDMVLGLTQDLLPVVSNPAAEISSKSKIKDKGKIPSRYNGNRKVSGFSEWPKYEASVEDIALWSKEKDYGICLQTRHVRALDVDVPEVAKADKILAFIEESLKVRLPYRYRIDSGKFLVAFRLTGEFPKRVVKVDGGIVEFLANGQQFIASGTHPGGARYEWDGLTEFPELARADFESLWKGLIEKFAIEPPISARPRHQEEDDIALHDDTLDKLTVLGWGPQKQAHIECPFKNEHTTDSGESATSYFPAGTKGYEQGHFVCLHAHCARRTDEEFLDALGLRAAEFEHLQTEAGAESASTVTIANTEERPASTVVWPTFKRTESGEIYPVIDNLYHALRRDDVCAAKIAYDSFRDDIVIASVKAPVLSWRGLTDNDYTLLQRHLERFVGFKPLNIDLLRRTVQAVAYENSFDSARLWIDGLVWDGKPRVDVFMAQYMKAEGNAYARAVSRYLWTALAGRALVPGIKADMVPIFESEQGMLKSSTVAALAPMPEYFTKISFSENEDNLSRKIRGRLVAEIAELRGLNTKELETIKDFVSSTQETWVPKWKERTTTFLRRLVFIGTTNQKEILADETGNRRWLPIHVGRADIEAIQCDRDQLWAEGREIFRKQGICFEEAERIAPQVHQYYAVRDPWEDVLLEWLNTPEDVDNRLPGDKGYLMMTEIMRQALHIEVRNMKGMDGKRLAKILRGNGYERVKKRIGERVEWVWKVPESLI